MKSHWLIASLICAFASQLPCAADNFSWTFQRTGYRSTSSTPQTALSMRSDLSWPVVYGIDQGALNAYSLFPVANPGPVPVAGPMPVNWHQIGTNLTKSFLPGGPLYLQAASGSPDGFGVSVQTPASVTQPSDVTIWGTTLGGFRSPQSNTQALKFDADGDPFIGTTAMIPNVGSGKLFDVALSKNGEVGAITQLPNGSGPVTFWQRSPLLGGNWFSSSLNLPQVEQALFGASLDLNYDSSSRPHVIGINRLSSLNTVAAYRFNIVSGLWQSHTLDTGVSSAPPIADVASAANDQGIVGAAWVNGGTLKYAYLDTNDVAPQWVVTAVASATSAGTPLELAQGVGLAYDKAGLPVISFIERSNRQIWIAYDPPASGDGGGGFDGDFNGDGVVDGGDLNQWNAAIADASNAADADGDGDSDGADFLAWQRNLSPAATSTAAAVPEPSGLAACLLAACLFGGASRRPRSRRSFGTTNSKL